MPASAFGMDAPLASPKAISLPDTALLYVSDYVSFVGEDHHGRVAFALDNNRGRDGESWQAEHFVVLHDEHEGWISLDSTPGRTVFRISLPIAPADALVNKDSF